MVLALVLALALVLVLVLVGLASAASGAAAICSVQDILVDPAFRKAGAGRALIQAVKKRCENLRQLVLITDD